MAGSLLIRSFLLPYTPSAYKGIKTSLINHTFRFSSGGVGHGIGISDAKQQGGILLILCEVFPELLRQCMHLAGWVRIGIGSAQPGGFQQRALQVPPVVWIPVGLLTTRKHPANVLRRFVLKLRLYDMGKFSVNSLLVFLFIRKLRIVE